jgi:hypothetical protein
MGIPRLKDPYSVAILRLLAEVPPELDLPINTVLDSDGITWEPSGDVEAVFKRLSDNVPLGSMDVLSEIRRQKNLLYAAKRRR